jgi:dGTPase
MLKQYACDWQKSRGRLFEEEVSKNRTPFQRDRDRIIHSSSFRRLEYKTQVFVNHESDHFRTRLTHSLEVAQIARVIAKKLELDQDLAEAVALSHDIGHPPFGHAGEDALNEAMKKFKGFDHNAQALKIVTELEDPYADYDGLNLSFECLEGILKHNGPIKLSSKTPEYIKEFNKIYNLDLKKNASMEAQIAAISDDIAYNNHDIDDGFRAGLLKEEDLLSVEIIADAFEEVDKKYGKIKKHKRLHEMRSIIYSALVNDVISETEVNLKKYKIETYEDVRNCTKQIVTFSKEIERQVLLLKKILMNKIYTHPKIQITTKKAFVIIKDLFEFYVNNSDCLEGEVREKYDEANKNQNKMVVIADYISGMTDRFAIIKHRELFDLHYLEKKFH